MTPRAASDDTQTRRRRSRARHPPAVRVPRRRRSEPLLTFDQRAGIALVGEFLAFLLSLALIGPLGWGAVAVMPVTVAVVVWWVSR